MMNMELWIPFVLAATLILIIPGPTILLVISQAVTHGRRSVVPLVIGVILGDFTAMTLSLLGLGALMSASAALFTVFKWVGTLYLIYLGIKLWKLKSENNSDKYNTKNTSARSLLKSSFIVTALNPKGIAFFVAFLPQFIDPLKPAFSQLTLLGGTFLLLATINSALYAIFAGQLGDQMKKKKIRKWFNRCGGSALIGAGIFTAAMQRST
ncbi:MAG: LysE family translocator [Desulfobacterales bacterium]|nr:LysE family translocator [Desulfobacterales bacterium]